jgi:hypothetical protein
MDNSSPELSAPTLSSSCQTGVLLPSIEKHLFDQFALSIRNYMSKQWFLDMANHTEPSPLDSLIAHAMDQKH